RTMWEVTDENRRLLSSWAASCDDPKRHLLADSIVKVIRQRQQCLHSRNYTRLKIPIHCQ
uniref:Transmembrane protein 199 n=1 Tax=Parascaris univalens TaxID=6257 RepID=A0A915BAL3_PARUN